MGEPVRLRVVFEDAGLLRGSQRRRGLQRCWLQLRPGIGTIADLASHLHVTFGLQSSCPHGLVISMDGFVLPSFESTCILRNEDLIMIKKNGVIFQDTLKFCGSQNQEKVLQSRQIPAFNKRNLTTMDPQVNSQVEENDTVLFNRSMVHIETPSEKLNEHYKRIRSNKLQSSNNTLAIMDPQGDLQGDEENAGLQGNIDHFKTTTYEMVDVKRKKKHANELQNSDTLTNKDSQEDSQGDKGSNRMMIGKRKEHPTKKYHTSDNTLAIIDPEGESQADEENAGLQGNIAHLKTTSYEMVNAKRKKKHANDLQNSDNTLAILDLQGDSQGDEENAGLQGNIAHLKTTSYELVNAKRKKKHANELQNTDTLANKDSQEDSQGDKRSNRMMNGKHKENPTKKYHTSDTLTNKDSQEDSKGDKVSNGMMNGKHKENPTKKYQTSDNTLAIIYTQGDSQGDEENAGLQRNIAHLKTKSYEMVNAKRKKKYANELQNSENESKETDRHLPINDANGDERKVPSRSARRKKAKKLWHRALKKEKKLIKVEIPEVDNYKKAPEYENADQNTNVDKEIVRVIVCPGHIRFDSSDACNLRADEPAETLQWNGTTSKKKGQKWGRENIFNEWDDDTSNWLNNGECSNAKEAELVEASKEKSAEVEAHIESTVKQEEPVKECSGNSVAKELEEVKQLFVFESCAPLIRLPEEGDVLVYRVVELSSSWCPELSPFRVGRVSSYDCSSSKVILLPLPEYPLILEEISEEGQESRSLYKDDGTLEVDFASLVDVRLFRDRESLETTADTTPIEGMQNASPLKIKESASCSSNRIESSSKPAVNNQLCVGWEIINQALNEKKAQLQQEQNDLDTRKTSLELPRPVQGLTRALRRNALGPILDMLRSSNGDTSK